MQEVHAEIVFFFAYFSFYMAPSELRFCPGSSLTPENANFAYKDIQDVLFPNAWPFLCRDPIILCGERKLKTFEGIPFLNTGGAFSGLVRFLQTDYY